jgi:hypothetical protein
MVWVKVFVLYIMLDFFVTLLLLQVPCQTCGVDKKQLAGSVKKKVRAEAGVGGICARMPQSALGIII